MPITEITAKTLLRKARRVESWFVTRYGMNLYRGCAHACAYCDGRAERYRVEGDFGTEIAAKVNAPELLTRELDPARRRKPLRRGYIFLGGGVCDAYQPAEAQYELARRALEIIAQHPFGVHVLTKSTLVERDLDLLTAIDQRQRAIVSMSFSSVDDEIARLFEPGSAPPSTRLETLRRCKARGLAVGMYLLPVIPGVSDDAASIERAVRAASDAELDFVVFGGMTLKGGRQEAHFIETLTRFDPDRVAEVRSLYPGDRWGSARPGYYRRLELSFGDAARRARVPPRIPPELYNDIMDDNDRVVVFLEHMDYLVRQAGRPGSYRRAANSVASLDVPIRSLGADLRRLPGVGPYTERLIGELLDRGSADAFEELLRGRSGRDARGRGGSAPRV